MKKMKRLFKPKKMDQITDFKTVKMTEVNYWLIMIKF